ncbi:MAG: ABC transporter substrate-binding protein [Luteitalea sp.]|nr:ABC transporter substrate-binding protein [Luteitalea sp.]
MTLTRSFILVVVVAAVIGGCGGSSGGVREIRIPKGAGGVGFLPLLVMEKRGLVEKHARAAGVPDLRVEWIELGGPSVLNDALLSGAADFAAAGPPAFLTLWDRTTGSLEVKGVAAMTSLPMYLNTRAEHLRTLDDVRETDRIAVTAPKVSIPALVMQMYAAERYGAAEATRFDRYTVTMTHPDGVIGLLSGAAGITAHFTSPPFHQRERKDPLVRTIMTTDDVMGGATTFTMLSTTTKFRNDNQAIYRAVLQALEEANATIVADRRAAADLLQASGAGGGLSADDLVALLTDPQIAFTTTPQNVKTYADFMHRIGSIRTRPVAWTDMFFPEIHSASGS